MRLPATQSLSDGELYYIIRNGVPLTGMPAWGEPHLNQDDESWQLALFIRHLSHLTAEEIKAMESYNPVGRMEKEEGPTEVPAAEKSKANPGEAYHQH